MFSVFNEVPKHSLRLPWLGHKRLAVRKPKTLMRTNRYEPKQHTKTSGTISLSIFMICTLKSNYRNLGTKHIMQTAVKHVRKKGNNTFQSVSKQYENQILYKRFQKQTTEIFVKIALVFKECIFRLPRMRGQNFHTYNSCCISMQF